MEQEIKQYAPDTVVRIKRTGVFALIIKRCYCGNNMPIHYECKLEGGSTMMLNHDEVELECLPVTLKLP